MLTDGDGGTNAAVYQTVNIVCPVAIDAMLVIDVSNSLLGTNFTNAKQAAGKAAQERVNSYQFAGSEFVADL